MNQSIRVNVVQATWARIHLGEIIRRAIIHGERFIVEKNDIPVVVILSIADYERLCKQAEQAHTTSHGAESEADAHKGDETALRPN